jgi:hypothetical protein
MPRRVVETQPELLGWHFGEGGFEGKAIAYFALVVRSWNTSRHGADIVNARVQPCHASLISSRQRSNRPGSSSNKRRPALQLALSLPLSAVVWGLRCSYTPILPTKRPKRPRIADDGKYIEKFFRHPFSFVRGD